MSAKIISVRSAVLFFALLLAAAGCTPAGPRALLKGKKYLDHGDYTEAAAQFKTATALLATNAAAWNYYGVALHRAGQPDDAISAYQHALELDRDLLEARLNLGTLLLEQNRAEEAKAEFTAYTLRRPNEAAGWLKLGAAQLKLGEIVPAERSFSAVLSLKTSEPEAYNGLGLARIQRGKPRDAAQFFAAAVQAKPDYPAAILNLATVSQQYLRDNKTALENYRAYLSLTPRPANYDDVNALANALEQSRATATPAPTPMPVTRPNSPPAPVAISEPKPTTKTTPVASTHLAQTNHSQHGFASLTEPAVKSAGEHGSQMLRSTGIANSIPTQTVEVAPEQRIVTTPVATSPAPQPAVEIPVPPAAEKPSFWHRVFAYSRPEPAPEPITPLPGNTVKPAQPVVIIPPAPVDFPRYNYLSPRRPAAGDRRAAGGAFTQARLAEQNENWDAALAAYRQAAELDPAWFEAQYNAGVIAHRLRNYSAALVNYETALALQPDSVDARYNFALALKASGFVPDAADELKKILAANPAEVRAHLALANLCAQQLHDPTLARRHYQKVLELDPKNAQAADIRFWLAANPE
jgi:tetratricopeptide (TPR) repeat protein